MALTKEEQSELAELEKEFSTVKTRAPGNSGLTPSEAEELASLEAEFSSQPIDDGPGLLESLGKGALDTAMAAGEFIDRYSGAPTRAAIGALTTGSNPASAFINQFGDDTELAPTGKEIAQNLGFSNQRGSIPRNPMAVGDEERAFRRPVSKEVEVYSPADVAGLGIDLAADPLNYIPFGPIVSRGAKATKAVTTEGGKIALKGSLAGIEALSGSNKVTRAVETSGKYLDEVAKSIKTKFNPSRAEDFEKFSQIASKNGIDPSILPETVEFGPNSTLTKKSKVIAEGPGGEHVQKRYMEAQAAVENAVDNQVKAYTNGVQMSPGDAGTMLLDGYNNGVKQFFDQDMLTHSKVINQNPGMVLNQDSLKNVQSKIQGLKNRATGRARRGIGGQRTEAKALLEDLDVLERSIDKNGNLSYKRASEMLSNIGEEAFKKYPPGTKIPTDQKGLQELYFSLRDNMYETAAHSLGPEAATEMALNNQIISDFLKEKGRISKIFEGDIAPEKLFKRIADSGDTKQIQALKEVLSPEDFNKFKGAYLENMLVKGKEGNILYGSSRKQMVKRRDQLANIFNSAELQNFDEVLQLGDRTGNFIFNTSNTNTASRFSPKEWIGEILTGGVDEIAFDRLKDAARNKSFTPIPLNGGVVNVSPTNARTMLKQIPLLNSTTRQIAEGGRLASVQETNREIEKRRRAMAGQ